jgi:hypothetical protein
MHGFILPCRGCTQRLHHNHRQPQHHKLLASTCTYRDGVIPMRKRMLHIALHIASVAVAVSVAVAMPWCHGAASGLKATMQCHANETRALPASGSQMNFSAGGASSSPSQSAGNKRQRSETSGLASGSGSADQRQVLDTLVIQTILVMTRWTGYTSCTHTWPLLGFGVSRAGIEGHFILQLRLRQQP